MSETPNRCVSCYASVGPSPGWHVCDLTVEHLVERLEIELADAAQDYEDENARFKARGGVIDRLEAEREVLRAEVRDVTVVADENFDRAEKAEAEVARLTLLCLDLVDPKLDTAPLPTSQPARAIEVCKRAAEPPREGKP